ncbi:hypothetical protein RRG08_029214 [Elysia crispata]|uniref:Uncharacterized protein n=1 Tax=Elysia crispata TaxID=231223 RepID=A0AAE1AIW7_9GAST|nr:hypothetical protein RRG08_029214 [Elysia crispata]
MSCNQQSHDAHRRETVRESHGRVASRTSSSGSPELSARERLNSTQRAKRLYQHIARSRRLVAARSSDQPNDAVLDSLHVCLVALHHCIINVEILPLEWKPGWSNLKHGMNMACVLGRCYDGQLCNMKDLFRVARCDLTLRSRPGLSCPTEFATVNGHIPPRLFGTCGIRTDLFRTKRFDPEPIRTRTGLCDCVREALGIVITSPSLLLAARQDVISFLTLPEDKEHSDQTRPSNPWKMAG